MEQKKQFARNLRKNSTKQERILWAILKNRQFMNLKFRRQAPIGDYIVDFVCKEKMLIIELDGGQHNTPEKIVYDNERSKFLKSEGYKIYRFWNNEVDNNLSGVYQRLLELVVD